ncbi:MAG TPA: DoxX family protein [Acidimicrobiia bacterium]|jgi:putative oxidoreductase
MTAPARTFDTSTSTGTRARRITTVDLDALARDVGLLAVRLTAGLLMAGHGAQKLFGWWRGPDFGFIVNGFAQAGYTPGKFFAILASSSEVVGGLFLALGLLTPLGSAAVIGVMFNAIVAVHWHSGVWAANGGYELPLLFGIVAVTLGLAGALVVLAVKAA